MPKCTNCGGWTAHKGTLCESCAALMGGSQNNPASPTGNDYSYSSMTPPHNDFPGQPLPQNDFPGQQVPDNTPPYSAPPVPQQDPGNLPDSNPYGYSQVPTQSGYGVPAERSQRSPFGFEQPFQDLSRQSNLQESPGVYTGIVANVSKFAPKRNRKGQVNALSRWCNSLFTGIPFSTRPVSCTFQLQLPPEARLMRQGVGDAISVHVFLDDTDYATDFAPGNRLRAYGKRGPHGYIYANSVQNLSTNTHLTGLGGIPSWIIRIVTLFMLAALFMMPSLASGFGGLPTFAGIQDTFVTIITFIILALVFVAVIRQNPKVRKYAIWIGITLVLGFINSGLASISILIGGIMMMLGYFR